MIKDIYIREALANDAEMIADLSRQTFYETFAEKNTKENIDKFLKEQFTKELLMQEVGAANNTFLLAYHNKEVAGYARLREHNIPPGLGTINALEIARIYAVTSMIGKGIGYALMEKCINIAKERGKECVWLGVWKKNKRAIKFYQQWGFEKFAEHQFILGDDIQEDWLMKKTVS